MDLKSDVSASESRFGAFVERLAVSLGHADRVAPMTAYCMGLILPGDRKSVEPMAARLEPGRVRAAHQSLHHFVAKADWSDVAVLDVVRNVVLPVITKSEPIRAWIIDDTGFPKKGTHSVGVARQYCGQLGKQDNCQVAVSLSVANEKASLPVAYRLYLPEVWAMDPLRRAKAGIPDDVIFKTKPQIAIEQIQTAKDAGIPPGIVLADAGYGVDTGFRLDLRKLDLDYIVGVQSSTSLCPRGKVPCHPNSGAGKGDRLLSIDATPSTSQFQPRRLPMPCPKMPGNQSHGARARIRRSNHSSLRSEFALPIATIGSVHRMPKNGSWSNGQMANRSRPNIGCHPCLPRRPSMTW